MNAVVHTFSEAHLWQLSLS